MLTFCRNAGEGDAERRRGRWRGKPPVGAGHNTEFADHPAVQRAGSVHLVEKLCTFFLLNIQNIHGEQAGRRDCGMNVKLSCTTG
jgi:hypothetical protein